MPDQCDGCGYYRTRAYGPKSVGECRFPVPVVQGQHGQWAEVQPDDWCGEFDALTPNEAYIQGGAGASDTALHLLLAVDTSYPIIQLTALQITNRTTNKDCLVGLYDGNSLATPLASAGCPQLDSRAYTYLPGVRSSSGNSIYFAIADAGQSVFVSAQGYKRRN